MKTRSPEDSFVFLCPLNLNANHFTLLEISEPDRLIYHYDSSAKHCSRTGHVKSSLVRSAVEVRPTSSVGTIR